MPENLENTETQHTSKFEKILQEIEQSGLYEYSVYLKSPARIIWTNFLLGMARGFGIIVGMSVVVALFGLIIKSLGGIPFIGDIFQWIGEEILNAQSNASQTIGR